MVRLREIPRTATFAWSPGTDSPWVVTGTKAGAVDVDFSNETSLELWDLGLDDTTQNQELQPKVTVHTEVGYAISVCQSPGCYANAALDSMTSPGPHPQKNTRRE